MPRRRRARRRDPKAPPEDTVAMIDRYLLSLVDRTVNGKVSRITALEAIVLQLQKAELDGKARASSVLLQYEDLCKRIVEKQVALQFTEDAYTRSLTGDTDHG